MSEEVPNLPPELTSPDPGIRRRALLGLAGQARSRTHLEIFRHVASSDPEAPIRLLARQLLQETTTQLEAAGDAPQVVNSATGTLDLSSLRRILSSRDTDSKIDAIRVTVETGDTTALSVFRELLNSEDDPWVTASLLKALGTLGDSQDIHLIQPFLKNEDLRIQANAIEALELIGDELSFSLVAPQLQSSDARIRANAIKCLVRFDPEEALDTLERMAFSDQIGSRESAVYCMGIVAHPRIAGIVSRMVPEESEPSLLEKELSLLGEEGGDESIGPLAFLVDALEDTLQEKAALALGRVRSRVEVSDQTVADARLQIETTQLKERKNKRALARLPEAVSSTPLAAPAEAEREVKEYLAQKRKKSKAPPPPPPSAARQVGTFLRENPSFAALTGITGMFLMASVALVIAPGESTGGAKTPIVRKPIKRSPRKPKKPTGKPKPNPNQKVTLQCTVNNIDRKRKTALLKHDGKILSVKLESTPPKGIKRNASVEVRGYYTGKVRFGAREFIAGDLRKL